MNERAVCKHLRKEFGKNGWALLAYSCIMNICVTAVCMIDSLIRFVLSDGSMDYAELVSQSVLSNAWGYALSVLLGLIGMRIWKGKAFCREVIWKTDNRMTFGSFAALLCVFFSGQTVFSILATLLELIFNLFDLSILESIQAASPTADSFSMFLYLTLLAPVTEEIFFRGLILRSLENYGKKFAILASAFLFGIFHGNIVQSPYAFVVGLVLGYVTVEYSIGWAMVLHMINNLVLGDMLTRMTVWLPGWVSEVASAIIIWGCTIAAIVILIVKREQIAQYFRSGKMHPWCVKSFFKSAGVVTLTVYMGINILLTLVLQAIG